MVTCGGQATIPIIHAISRIVPVIMQKLSQRFRVFLQVLGHGLILMNLQVQHPVQLKLLVVPKKEKPLLY